MDVVPQQRDASQSVAPQTGGRRMSPLPKSLLGRLGKAWRSRNEHMTREALPKRWIDLLHHLDEQERRQSRPSPSASAPPTVNRPSTRQPE